jgi:hypothetical protein
VSKQEEYMRHAAKCILLAEDSESSLTRLPLMEIAQAWLRLAGHAEKNERVTAPAETTPADQLAANQVQDEPGIEPGVS